MLRTRLNSIYYLAKKERSFSNFDNFLVLEEKNGIKKTQGNQINRAAASFTDFIGKSMKDYLVKDHYYAILTDGSTDSGILKQEALYVLFLSPSSGLPVLKFLSVESPQYAHADGLKACIVDSFHRISITPLHT